MNINKLPFDDVTRSSHCNKRMPRYFFVFAQVGTDEYIILAEGIDSYDNAVEIRDAYVGECKNKLFIVASLNLSCCQ